MVCIAPRSPCASRLPSSHRSTPPVHGRGRAAARDLQLHAADGAAPRGPERSHSARPGAVRRAHDRRGGEPHAVGAYLPLELGVRIRDSATTARSAQREHSRRAISSSSSKSRWRRREAEATLGSPCHAALRSNSVPSTLSVTSTLPRVAFEYGQRSCARRISSSASARARRGACKSRATAKPKPP